MAKVSKRVLAFRRALVLNYLKKDIKISWAGEMRLAGMLTERFPDPKFWRGVVLGFELNTLAFFLSAAGREILKEREKHYNKEREMKVEKKATPEFSMDRGADYKPDSERKRKRDFFK